MDFEKLAASLKAKKAAMKQKNKTIKPNPGENRYVLLPGWRKGEEHIFDHAFGQHFIKNAAGEIQAVYPCLSATYDRQCPVCDGIASAMRLADGDDVVKQLEEASCGFKKRTHLVNVLALDSEDPTTPQILELRKSAFEQLIKISDEWMLTLFDPNEPQIIVVNRDGKGLTTKYTVQISPKRHQMPKGALEKLHDLDEYVTQENEETQRRALNAINSAVGVLPSPSGADRPATTRLDRDQDDELSAVAARPTASVSRNDVAIGDELDDLLSDLTGTNG